jgi:hypothetical protein
MVTEAVRRRRGISSPANCQWPSQLGSLELPDANWIRTLEEENTQFKKLPAEAMPDKSCQRVRHQPEW